MFIYTNVNPTGKKTGDCVIRAVAIATGESWEKTYIDLCAEGLALADLPNANSVWGAYLRKKGFTRSVIPNTCPDCYTIADFCVDHPYGRYVVGTGSHAAAIVSGNLMDAWDSSNEIAIFYYAKEEEE